MIAALFLADLPWQALVRAEPDYASLPVAMVTGQREPGGGSRIGCVSPVAQGKRITPGMTVAQARGLCRELVVLPRRVPGEQSCLAALRDVAASFAPRIELGQAGSQAWVYAEVDGLDKLIGPPEAVAAELMRAAHRVGLSPQLGIARNKILARLMARAGCQPPVLRPDPELEHAFVAELPLALLGPSPVLALTCERFGLQCVADLLALPREQIATRLGPEALALYRQARGEEETGIHKDKEAPRFIESRELDFAIDNLEPLAFVIRGLVASLAARLQLRGYAVAALHLSLGYEYQGSYERTVKTQAPTRDVHALVTLCRLILAQAPPPRAITRVRIEAIPQPVRVEQLSLLEPAGPPPEALAVTVARLTGLCGQERVGSPRPANSYQRDDFFLAPFTASSQAGCATAVLPSAPPVSLHRLRPPQPVEVIIEHHRPIRIEGSALTGRIHTWKGPYRHNLAWWRGAGEPKGASSHVDIYDMELSDGACYRLAYEGAERRWWLEGWYD